MAMALLEQNELLSKVIANDRFLLFEPVATQFTNMMLATPKIQLFVNVHDWKTKPESLLQAAGGGPREDPPGLYHQEGRQFWISRRNESEEVRHGLEQWCNDERNLLPVNAKNLVFE